MCNIEINIWKFDKVSLVEHLLQAGIARAVRFLELLRQEMNKLILQAQRRIHDYLKASPPGQGADAITLPSAESRNGPGWIACPIQSRSGDVARGELPNKRL